MSEKFQVVNECNKPNELIDFFSLYQSLKRRILDRSTSIVNNFFYIGKCLYEIETKQLYVLEDYSDIYEFAKDHFNYESTSVKNMINVYLKYKSENSDYVLDNKFSKYSYSALVELLPVDKDEIVNSYSSDLSVKAIRQAKKVSQLSDYLKELIDRFEDVVEIVKDSVDFLNTKIKDKKYHINFKLVDKSIDINQGNVVYNYNFNTKKYYDAISYEYLKISPGEAKIYLFREDITELTNIQIQNMLKEKFDLYYEHVLASIERDIKEIAEKNELERKEKLLPYKVNTQWIESSDFISGLFNYLANVVLLGEYVYCDYIDYRVYKNIEEVWLPLYYDQNIDNLFGWFAVNENEEKMAVYDLEENLIVERSYKYEPGMLNKNSNLIIAIHCMSTEIYKLLKNTKTQK